MRVIEARGRYEVPAPGAGQPAKFSTWLYTIAHHRLVDHWRKRGLQLVSLDQADGAPVDPPGNPGEEPQSIAEAKQGL